jgi:hypothetical protein
MIVGKPKQITVNVKRISWFLSKTGLRQALAYNLKGALMLLTKAYEAYGEAKTKSQLWHDKHLDSLNESWANRNKSTPEKELKAHKRIEGQRKQACNVKCIQQKLGNGAVTKLYYTKNNIRTECATNVTMESACISRNNGRFLQTNDTPPMEDSLIAGLGYLAKTNDKYRFLEGAYVPPTGTNQYMCEFLEVPWMPHWIRNKVLISTSITPEEHCQGWKQQKERTAAKSTGPSFSHKAASSESLSMAEMDRIFRELPYKHGFCEVKRAIQSVWKEESERVWCRRERGIFCRGIFHCEFYILMYFDEIVKKYISDKRKVR